MRNRLCELGVAFVVGTVFTALLYWIDLATADPNSLTTGWRVWIAYLSSPGLLITYVIVPTGVHSGVNILAVALVFNALFYSTLAYLIVVRRKHHLRRERPSEHM